MLGMGRWPERTGPEKRHRRSRPTSKDGGTPNDRRRAPCDRSDLRDAPGTTRRRGVDRRRRCSRAPATAGVQLLTADTMVEGVHADLGFVSLETSGGGR